MESTLPSTERLLGEFLRMNPHTRDGQIRAAHRVLEYVEQCNLGTAELLEFPVNTNKGIVQYPLVKIESTFGVEISDRTDMTWLGHMDTVPLTREQRQKDPLELETASDSENSRTIGKGRGTLDMWGGNIAMLAALQLLSNNGGARLRVHTVLSSREEAGSEVLYQAIKQNAIHRSPVGATTEILVGDAGKPSPMYIGRTGRIGIHATFRHLKGADKGNDENSLHLGALDRYPERIDRMAARYHARAMDELLDAERGFTLTGTYPGDSLGIFPQYARAIPMDIAGTANGLSAVDEIYQKFAVFHIDPNTAPESVRALLLEYLVQKANIPAECIELRLEDRSLPNGDKIPFTDPYMTLPDHPFALAGQKYASDLRTSNVPMVAASGVAEDGMIFHQLGTKMIGWSPDGGGAHGEEWVDIQSIEERAVWLAKLAQYDGDLS